MVREDGGGNVLTGAAVAAQMHALETVLPFDSTLIVWGSMQGNQYTLLYLAGVISPVDMVLLPSYLSLEPAVRSVVRQLNTSSLSLVVPAAHLHAACRVVRAHERSGIRVRLVSLGAATSCNATAWDEMVGPLTAPRNTSVPPSTARRRPARQFVARRDVHGLPELTVWEEHQLGSYARQQASYCAQHQIGGLHVTPVSSPDAAPFILGGLVCGFPIVAMPRGFSRLGAHVDALSGPYEIVANPAQWRWVEEAYRLHAFAHARVKRLCAGSVPQLAPRPLVRPAHACMCGGGAVEPRLVEIFRKELSCRSVLVLWGSMELGSIGASFDGGETFTLADPIRWDVRPIGPYGQRHGQRRAWSSSSSAVGGAVGELWLETRTQARHADGVSYAGRVEDGLVRTRNVVLVLLNRSGVPARNIPATRRVQVLDKTTALFRMAAAGKHTGSWVPTGLLERRVESAGTVLRAAIFSASDATDGGGVGGTSPSSAALVCVVWPTDRSQAHDAATFQRWVEAAVTEAVKSDGWPVPSFTRPPIHVVVAGEPWEYRPRAKLQAMLREYFLGAGGEPVSARHAAAGLMHHARLLRAKMHEVAAGAVTAGATGIVDDALIRILCRSLLACLADGACFQRNHDGSLREPERRLTAYDPDASLSARLARFDDVPWQLWDGREACATQAPAAHNWECETTSAPPSAIQLAAAIRMLSASRELLLDVIPAVMPSLGLLQPLGMRFRLRLECAAAVATQAPELLGQRSADVYVSVLRICRPEWFETVEAPQQARAATPWWEAAIRASASASHA